MLKELRWNPRSPAARTWSRCPGESAATETDQFDPRLSTEFAGRTRLRSTTAWEPIHSALRGLGKEGVE
jgi:hypothetical protein